MDGAESEQDRVVVDPALIQLSEQPPPPSVPEPPPQTILLAPLSLAPPQPSTTPVRSSTRKKRNNTDISHADQNVPPVKKTKTASSSTAPSKPRKKAKKQEKEEVAALSEPPPSRHLWKDHETSSLFQNLLGPDADKVFQTLLTNPQRAFDQISSLVAGGTFSASACKGKYERSRTVYGWIREFEKFTGGGGDGDHEDEDGAGIIASYGRRLEAAKQQQKAVGNLTPAVICQWESNGWMDPWNSRFAKAPNITRVIVRNSDEPVSDWEDDRGLQVQPDLTDDDACTPAQSIDDASPVREDIVDDGADSATSTTTVKPPTTPAPKSTSGTVTEPKSTPRRSTSFQESASQSLNNVNKFIDLKTKGEERRLGVIEAQLDLNRKREDRLEREAEARKETEVRAQKVQMATSVLGNAHVSEEVKAAANKYLMDFFTSN
ncbi:hypothetical protein PM082_022625 [Marasmius tenuissimus]|nr:hypothetical protein PM082_022625 [Marasmius tenuissimus]